MSLLGEGSQSSRSQTLVDLRGRRAPSLAPISVSLPIISSYRAYTDDDTTLRPSTLPTTDSVLAVSENIERAAEDTSCGLRPASELGDDDCGSRDNSAVTSQGSIVSAVTSATTVQSSISCPTPPLAILQTTAANQRTYLQNPGQYGPYAEVELEDTKGLFALPAMGMSDMDMCCCSQIQSRLSDAIFNIFRPKMGVDCFYSLESMMVKSQGHTPKATVVLTCCNKDNKKQLQKIVRSQRKAEARLTGPNKYPIIVHVGEATRRIADESGITGDYVVHAYVPENSPTMSGVVAEVGGQFGVPRARFTIGGTVLVDRVPYSLSVGHSFQIQTSSSWDRNDFRGADEESGEDDSDETDSDNESLYAIFNLDDDQLQTPSETAMEVAQLEQNISWPFLSCETEQLRRICVGSSPILSRPQPSTDFSGTRPDTDYDWALIPLELEHVKSTPNLISIPGARFPIEVTGYTKLEGQGLSSLEVWINAGISGLQKGWLVESTALLDFGGTLFRTERIVLRKPLLAGDSGSWVVSHGQVCGHIVAAKTSLPWAYMVPFDNIIKDIQSTMKTEDVRLPSMAAALIGQDARAAPLTCDHGTQTKTRDKQKNKRSQTSETIDSAQARFAPGLNNMHYGQLSGSTVASESDLAYEHVEYWFTSSMDKRTTDLQNTLKATKSSGDVPKNRHGYASGSKESAAAHDTKDDYGMIDALPDGKADYIPPEDGYPHFPSHEEYKLERSSRFEPGEVSRPVKRYPEYLCFYIGCRQKPFKRSADLDRHIKHVHKKPVEKYYCDYNRCQRSERVSAATAAIAASSSSAPIPSSSYPSPDSNSAVGTGPFGRKDHCRDHYRTFHKEDLCRRNGQEHPGWFDDRNISTSWWRCTKCLKRVSYARYGWDCNDCEQRLEPERVNARKRQLVELGGYHDQPTQQKPIDTQQTPVYTQQAPSAYSESMAAFSKGIGGRSFIEDQNK